MTGNVTSLEINFHIYLSEQSSAPPHRRRYQFKWKDVIAIRTYVTRKVYSHSLIHTQLRLSNLSADCLFIKAWGLPPLDATIGGEGEKPVGRNRPSPLVKKDVSFLIG